MLMRHEDSLTIQRDIAPRFENQNVDIDSVSRRNEPYSQAPLHSKNEQKNPDSAQFVQLFSQPRPVYSLT